MSDVEPTINGVGGEGFAVDGTDSFAIEPTALADEPGGPPRPGRRGLYLTLATGLVLLLIVVIAGSAGDDGESSLRGEAAASSTTTTSMVAAERDRRSTAAESGISGDDQRSSAASGFDAEDMFTSEYDGLIVAEVPYDDEFGDIEDFDDFEDYDFEDFDDFDDDDYSSSGGGRYLPRRVPYVPSTRRPTITVPPWYRGTTTTTEAPSTTEDTTTSSTTPTTVPDTAPPSAPVLNGVVGITNDPTPRFAGSGEDGSTVTVSEGASALCTAAVAGGAWSCDSAQSLADGMHSVVAEAVDAAGNRSTGPTVSFTIDTRGPVAPAITSPADRSGTPDPTPTLIGTGEEGATVTVAEGTTALCTATVAVGVWSCTPTLAAGAHTLTPTAVDTAGNSTAGTPVQVTVDSSSPVITTPADGSGTPDTTPTITGTSAVADGSTVTVSLAGTARCTAIVSQGAWSCDSTVLALGTHVLTSAAGTVPGTSIRLTIAAAAPAVTEPANGSTVAASTVRFAGTGANGDTVTVTEGLATICSDVVEGGAWTCTSGTLIDGPHTFVTSARAAAGTSVPGTSVTVTIDAP